MERSVGRLVSILYRKNQVYLNIALKPFHITASELPILTFLFSHSGVTQEKLSSFLLIDKASTARAVQSLLRKGLLRKERDLVDRRANKIYMSETGQALKPQIAEILQQWSSFLTGGLDAQSVDTMYTVLESMVKKLETADLREIGRND